MTLVPPNPTSTALSDIALYFVFLGQSYARAAKLLAAALKPGPLSLPDLPPAFSTSAHAVELGLKGYLALQGVSMDTLKSQKYGHKIGVLYAEARKQGLPELDPNFEWMVGVVTDGHQNRGFSYPVSGVVAPDPSLTIYLAEVLLQYVGQQAAEKRLSPSPLG